MRKLPPVLFHVFDLLNMQEQGVLDSNTLSYSDKRRMVIVSTAMAKYRKITQYLKDSAEKANNAKTRRGSSHWRES